MDYRGAGVDIAAGDAFIQSIKPLVTQTRRRGVIGTIGGFAALFDLKATGFRDPLLVSSTDGVGTKLKLAIDTNQHDTIGIDLVAMCVNDLLVHGAKPLFFLDYFATATLRPEIAQQVLKGIAEGCIRAGCALVGGETAEMPALYQAGDYDLAGFVVGAVERDLLLPGLVEEGDQLIGVASSGLHSNGYSLLHHLRHQHGFAWTDPAPFAKGQSFAEVFLTPTRIYVDAMLDLHAQGLLEALAHITGSGLPGNLPRVLPDGLQAVIDQPWPVPAEFHWIAQTGKVAPADMLQTFNCGIGMVLIVSPLNLTPTLKALTSHGEVGFPLGHIAKGQGVVIQSTPF